MVSEWLELDASDDWVRHDAEIVRSTTISSSPRQKCPLHPARLVCLHGP